MLNKFLMQKTFVLHQVGIQHIVMIGQAVGQYLNRIKLRGEAAQRLNQACITSNFDIQIGHDSVVGRAVFIEVVEFAGHLFQRITDVEGIFLLLGIQHQRQFVAFFYDAHHLLVLHFVLAGQLCLRLVYLTIVMKQFTA